MNAHKPDLTPLLGKTVTVVVDRPLGFLHKGMVYPVNYGFLPGMLGGDGEEQDAYILCLSTPVEQFTGEVIGIVVRHDDREDKLVVAPKGTRMHQGQIMEAVWFQEQFFQTSVICLLRKSCGVVPLRSTSHGLQILLVFEAFSQCWSIPKGHMEHGETEEQTALRELWEEAGLTAQLIPGRRAVVEYPIGSACRKEMVLFPGWASDVPVPRPGEITQCRWVDQADLPDYLFPDTLATVQSLLRDIVCP